MGQSLGSVTFSDGLVYDIDQAFCYNYFEKPAVVVSGGVDSTLLMYILKQYVGAENVLAISARITEIPVPPEPPAERRVWEKVYGADRARELGIRHRVTDSTYVFINGAEDLKSIRRSLRNWDASYDAFFVGDTRRWYSRNEEYTEDIKARQRSGLYLTPFAGLQKKHIIELYYLLGAEQYLSNTWSCTIRGSSHCGSCYCCLERHRGFVSTNKPDPAVYDNTLEQRNQLMQDTSRIVNVL